MGDSADGYPGIPGWGAKSAAAVLARWGSLDDLPARASAWDVPGLRGAVTLAAALAERGTEVELYRTLARLRLDAALPQVSVDELRWDGADRAAWEGLCDELGLARLRGRPHRWRQSA